MSGSRDYFEPWVARAARAYEPEQEEDPRPMALTPWVVWGTNAQPAGPAVSLLGGFKKDDPGGIVTIVRAPTCRGEVVRSPQEIAHRIAVCVNACHGIENPVVLMDQVVDFLTELSFGRVSSPDLPAARLLSRLVKPETER